MKFKYGENVLLALLLLFLELIKRCYPYVIEMVDPLVIKINPEKLEIIPIIVLLNKTIEENREDQKIKLIKVSTTSPFSKEIKAIEENKQDQNNKRKIEFAFNQEDFLGEYGRYLLTYENGYSSVFTKTILIYANDIILKNPKKKYFLTGTEQENIEVRYDISSIFKDEINEIKYYEASKPSIPYNLSKSDYSIEGKDNNIKLVLKFPRANSYSSYIFDIYPEYDKDTSNSEIQRFYLYFHDYLLNNDAIYINKNDYTNEVPFNLTFRNGYNLNLLSIRGYSFRYSHLNNNNYEITINLGRQNSPGKIYITYDRQERELFYILYDFSFKRCYDKEEIVDLIITMEWIDEMEYDHMLYFNDTTTKLLASSYAGKSGNTVIYKYRYSTLSLNSGLFSLKSTIAALNYSSYNPVDNKHIYFYIYPNSQIFDKNTSIIYSNNNSAQYIYISSSEDDAITVLDEIILQKNGDSIEFLVSKANQECNNNNTHFFCNLKDKILNSDSDKIVGNYSIIYKSKCGKNLTIDDKLVIIRKGIGLSDISPKWINKSIIKESELILTYDADLTGRNLVICFTIENDDKSPCKYNVNNYRKDKEKIIVILDDMDKGRYYVKTIISEDLIEFVQKDKSFKVSDPKIKFKFNHHYFVKNDNPENKLKITVENIENNFGCKIVDNLDNHTLKNGSNNCTIFEYEIIKTGTIKFNYYDDDDIIIPINDYIVVVSTYPQFFTFNEKFCYYYLFNISIDILNSYKSALKIKVFLRDRYNYTFLLNNIENKYTYKDINDSNISFFDTQGFDLYISEETIDPIVYLYKSNQKVKFTEIKTPEFIIDPNRTIVFSNVNCDLNSSAFKIIKMDETDIQNTLAYWKYDSFNRYLFCNITGDFYKTNRFKYYYYQIDYNNINNINNESELYKTFVSKRLNETNFDLRKAESNDYVTITNKDKDFYFPLIKGLNTFQEYRTPRNKSSKRGEDDLEIDNAQFTIKFKYKLAINDVLRIDYLERTVYDDWEERKNLGDSMYYFFKKDNIINGSSLDISPKLFAFNIPKKEEYIITILYSEEKQKNYKKSNLTNCTNSTNNNLEEECYIDFPIKEKTAQSIIINITDGITNSYENIDFIYYDLDENSKKCQTMNNNMNNLTLLVYIPSPNLKDKIKLDSPDTDIIDRKNETSRILFILNGTNINLQKTYLRLFTDDEDLDHWFTLQNLGIDILPKYKIRFNNNENVSYLLPEDNQVVKVIISVDNNEIMNMNDISGFKIKGENNKNLESKVGIDSINGEQYSLNLKFNLSSINQSEQNYSLYYIDRCGKEFQTDLKVSLVTFNFKRKYFVLNNNNKLNSQILIIEGPVDDKISIVVYRNGEYNGEAMKNTSNTPKNYYLSFSQSSQGNYTFRVINDGIESNINEIVYVRENLEEILRLKNNITDCMFSNSNKSAIKDFSYTITPSNLNTNFRNFQSYYSSNQKDFINLTSSGDGADKTFSIIYTNAMKSEINLDNKLYIYLTENYDIDQPIYIFDYKYTNIQLHPDFAKFIYSDADYISFIMNCKINNMKNFEFNNINGNTFSITCEDRETNDIYIEESKIFKCYLSSSDHGKNRLLNFGATNFEYHNYNIKYDQIQITNESFFFSQDIYHADFTIRTPSQIDRNVNININVTTPRNFFNFSKVDKVFYKKNNDPEKEIAFKYNSNNYIFFELLIENKTKYYINKICRESCSYCKKGESYIEEVECKLLQGDAIETNTPEVFFTFDKHYIALQNSAYKNIEKDNTISLLTITLDGENKNEIHNLIYYHYTTLTNNDGERNINRQNDKFQLNLSVGKYIFQYRFNGKTYNIRDIVLVTNYDYEMFDFSDFSSHCVFYDLSIPGLLVSINPNSNYVFKNDITLAYLFLELNGIPLPYHGEKGYQINDFSLFSNNYNFFDKIYLRESNIPETNFVFTTLYNISSNTLDIYNQSKYLFFYKDNIIFEEQECKSNNIYIRSISNPSEDFSLLQCEYNISSKIQYCNTDYRFSYKTNDIFYLYFGNNKLNSSFVLNIYNSINSSLFELYYIKPTIYIHSPNFEMSKINKIYIDNDPINITNNKISDSNIISYNYEFDNTTVHYVRQLWREDLKYDRITTIKNKIVNLKIEKRKCPDFTVEVLTESGSLCITCYQKAFSLEGNGLNKWYQNGECVPSCSGDYYIYDSVNHYCLNCSERTSINGQTVCGCFIGTVKSPLDGVCYLPEDPEVKRASLLRSRIQCYRTDGITDNYCKNGTTSKCEVVSYSGADFPICHCKDGYTGKYCENKINEINLNNNMDIILSETINDKIDESNPEAIAKIRGITYFIEQDNSYTTNIDINKINSFLEASINCINDAINEKHNYPQIYDVIEITVHFLIYKIKNSKRLRLLEEEDEKNRNNLKFVLKNAHYLNYLANKNYTGNNYIIQGDGLDLISFISYRPDTIDSYFRTYIKNMTANSSIVGYTNLRNNKVNDNGEDEMAVLTIFNRKLFNLDSLEDGLIFNFSISDNNINLADLKDFYIYFYSQNMNVNYELANYYQARNINIYDKYDPCFTDACFTSENFEFDLTQKYRKKNVFQKWSLDSEICKYHSFENASNNIEISCQKFEDFGKMGDDSYNYATLNLIAKKDYVDNQDKVYNLPMKCKKKMNSKNYAFWIFLIICILEIIYIIGITILTLGSLRRVSIKKGLINDGLFYIIPRIINTNDDITSNNDNPLNNKYDEKYKSTNEILEKPIGSYNKTLLEGLLSNFKELHPLSVLCRVSIISPLIMNSWFLVYNILILFGFNALIYYEGLIEKRIYDKKRNYFDYPMRKEFHKIILSILLQIAFTVIIKVIVLVLPSQYENLESKLRNCKMKGEEINNDIIVRYDDFQDEMFIRRLIGGFLMTIIIIFFFYYNVVFCEVYLNTQRNLVFSWVWSLFWEWVIFAPIYIVVISVLENKKSNSKDPVVYYLKRLFFF